MSKRVSINTNLGESEDELVTAKATPKKRAPKKQSAADRRRAAASPEPTLTRRQKEAKALEAMRNGGGVQDNRRESLDELVKPTETSSGLINPKATKKSAAQTQRLKTQKAQNTQPAKLYKPSTKAKAIKPPINLLIEEAPKKKKPTPIPSDRPTRNNPQKSYHESSDSEDQSQKPVNELTFAVPTKRSLFAMNDDIEETAFIPNVALDKNTENLCPVDSFCKKIVKKPYSQRLQKLYDKYLKVQTQHKLGKCSLRTVVACRDQFCQYHKAEESIIPMGVKKGYPMTLNPTEITKNLNQSLKRLQQIISGSVYSYFKSKIHTSFQELGKSKGQAIENRARLAEWCEYGYYGVTGSDIIHHHLSNIIPPLLTSESTYPLSTMDYIQFIIVPEACLCLVALDQGLDVYEQYEECLDILKSSSEFGQIVHDNDDLLPDL